VKRVPGGFCARFGERCAIQALLGGRDPAFQRALREAFEKGSEDAVRSLRMEPHAPEPACWLHAEGYCLSTRTVGESS